MKDISALFESFQECEGGLTFLRVADSVFDGETPISAEHFIMTSRYTPDQIGTSLDEGFANEHIAQNLQLIFNGQRRKLIKALEKFHSALTPAENAANFARFIETYKQKLLHVFTTHPQLHATVGFEMHTDAHANALEKKEYVTIDTVRQHLLSNEFMANILLGYNTAEKRIMTLEEKMAFVKSVETPTHDDKAIVVSSQFIRPQSFHYQAEAGEILPTVPDRLTSLQQYSHETHALSPEAQLETDYAELLVDRNPFMLKVMPSLEEQTIAHRAWDKRTKRVKRIVTHDAARR